MIKLFVCEACGHIRVAKLRSCGWCGGRRGKKIALDQDKILCRICGGSFERGPIAVLYKLNVATMTFYDGCNGWDYGPGINSE